MEWNVQGCEFKVIAASVSRFGELRQTMNKELYKKQRTKTKIAKKALSGVRDDGYWFAMS
eukprot:scaffold591885_cov29-Prasinocladus_malaysianus.AAC.1